MPVDSLLEAVLQVYTSAGQAGSSVDNVQQSLQDNSLEVEELC